MTLVETMPSMLAGDTGVAVRRAIDTLAERTLRGELGAEVVFSRCAILGPGFVDRCVTAVKNDTTGKLHVLAVSLSRAVPNDEHVFEALAIHAGRHPRPLGT